MTELLNSRTSPILIHPLLFVFVKNKVFSSYPLKPQGLSAAPIKVPFGTTLQQDQGSTKGHTFLIPFVMLLHQPIGLSAILCRLFGDTPSAFRRYSIGFSAILRRLFGDTPSSFRRDADQLTLVTVNCRGKGIVYRR